MSEKEAQLHPVIAVRVKPDLSAWADEQAAIEGISRSDVARRALIRDRQRQLAEERAAGSMKQKNEIALIVRKPKFDLQSAARSNTREALRVLVEIMTSKDASPRARVAAAKALRRHLKVIGGSMSDDKDLPS